MEYKGKLYAKIANKYLEISHTDEFEKLESKVSKHVELSFELDGIISDLNKKHVTEITSRNKRINDLETELTELKEKHMFAMDLVGKVKNYQINKVTANDLYKLADRILQIKI